ncbi:hypothetical protein B0F90DRAFT_1835495, partial [Multifurca ochricompacta]
GNNKQRFPRVQARYIYIRSSYLKRARSLPLFSVSLIIQGILCLALTADRIRTVGEWSPSPLATTDFAATTTKSNGSDLTDYLHPINWVLSSGSGKNSTVIVISPHEANELLPDICKSKTVRLHIYAPRVTTSMRSFSNLAFYSIPALPTGSWSSPAHVRTELNLFSGQLY